MGSYLYLYVWPNEGERGLLENGNIWQIYFQSEMFLIFLIFLCDWFFFPNKTFLFSIVKCLKFARNFALDKLQ